jgi:hypothetical protein
MSGDDPSDDGASICFGDAKPTDRNFADVLCRDGEIVELLAWIARHSRTRRRSLQLAASLIDRRG